MLKFLFFTVLFFLLVRFINRLFLPKEKQKSFFKSYNGTNRKSNKIDSIEEADYEDLTEKDKK